MAFVICGGCGTPETRLNSARLTDLSEIELFCGKYIRAQGTVENVGSGFYTLESAFHKTSQGRAFSVKPVAVILEPYRLQIEERTAPRIGQTVAIGGIVACIQETTGEVVGGPPYLIEDALKVNGVDNIAH